jgi:hypothetical protein
MGGPAPIKQDALVMRVTNETAEQVAAVLQQSGVEFAILSGSRDSAFYADVAARAGLKSTRTGHAGSTTYSFLGPEALGDTTLALKIRSGGELRLHDALYRVDKTRRLDLMAVRIEENANIRDAVRSLLDYVSTDVMATAAVVLAVDSPSPAVADSVSVLLRAMYTDVWECTEAGKKQPRNGTLTMRMMVGPSTRARCDTAEQITNGMVGHLVLLR